MRERIIVPCKNCKGIKRDGTGICCLCGSRWMACKLQVWGEKLVCSRCLEARKKSEQDLIILRDEK